LLEALLAKWNTEVNEFLTWEFFESWAESRNEGIADIRASIVRIGVHSEQIQKLFVASKFVTFNLGLFNLVQSLEDKSSKLLVAHLYVDLISFKGFKWVHDHVDHLIGLRIDQNASDRSLNTLLELGHELLVLLEVHNVLKGWVVIAVSNLFLGCLHLNF
jgi:hypothetical protein